MPRYSASPPTESPVSTVVYACLQAALACKGKGVGEIDGDDIDFGALICLSFIGLVHQYDLMRQCLPELADTILQAWEAYQCSRYDTYLPFLLSGKEVSERKRQQRLSKRHKYIVFYPPPRPS